MCVFVLCVADCVCLLRIIVVMFVFVCCVMWFVIVFELIYCFRVFVFYFTCSDCVLRFLCVMFVCLLRVVQMWCFDMLYVAVHFCFIVDYCCFVWFLFVCVLMVAM